MARRGRRIRWKNGWEILKETAQSFVEDRAMRLSAALAYYSIFSLAPLLLLAAGVAGLVFGHDAVRREVERQLTELTGAQTAHALQTMMEAWQKSGSGMATVFSIVALVLGASGVFGQLQDALNAIWRVKAKPGRSAWRFVRDRFLSLAMVLGTGFLLLVSLILTTLLNAFAGRVGTVLPIPESVAHALNSTLSFVVISLLFAMIFKFLPDVKVAWRNVWIGAIGTALLFTGGKELLGLYLGREGTVSAYGAAGSIVVIVLWVYYASLILFWGAEFVRVFALKTGSAIRPSEYAVPVTGNERVEQGLSNSKQGKGGYDNKHDKRYDNKPIAK
jgi:membrane protein